MSFSNKDSSSSSSRGNPPNGRKRRLGSRSHSSNSPSSTSPSSTRTISSYSLKNRDSNKKSNLKTSPQPKRGRFSSVAGSPKEQRGPLASLSDPPGSTFSYNNEYINCPSTSGCTEWCGFSQSSHNLELESNMSQIPKSSSASGCNSFSNNFAKGGGLNIHKRPGQGKKIVIKNRKGKGLSAVHTNNHE